MRLLRNRVLWPAPSQEHVDAEVEPDSLLPLLAAASIQGRVALGPDAGQRIERAGGEPLGADRFDAGAGSLCAHQDGFSLHTEVHVKAHDRTRLEHLCRYVARGPIVSERLSLSSEGEVIYELRRAWRDGTTHIVFDPLTSIERLAARVPGPRVHLVTYHPLPLLGKRRAVSLRRRSRRPSVDADGPGPWVEARPRGRGVARSGERPVDRSAATPAFVDLRIDDNAGRRARTPGASTATSCRDADWAMGEVELAWEGRSMLGCPGERGDLRARCLGLRTRARWRARSLYR